MDGDDCAVDDKVIRLKGDVKPEERKMYQASIEDAESSCGCSESE